MSGIRDRYNIVCFIPYIHHDVRVRSVYLTITDKGPTPHPLDLVWVQIGTGSTFSRSIDCRRSLVSEISLVDTISFFFTLLVERSVYLTITDKGPTPHPLDLVWV